MFQHKIDIYAVCLGRTEVQLNVLSTEDLAIANSSVDKTFYFWYSYLIFLLSTLTAVLHQLESNQVHARCIFFKNNAPAPARL